MRFGMDQGSIRRARNRRAQLDAKRCCCKPDGTRDDDRVVACLGMRGRGWLAVAGRAVSKKNGRAGASMPCEKARGAMWLPCARLPSLRGGAPLCRACEAPPEGTVLPSLRGSLSVSPSLRGHRVAGHERG